MPNMSGAIENLLFYQKYKNISKNNPDIVIVKKIYFYFNIYFVKIKILHYIDLYTEQKTFFFKISKMDKLINFLSDKSKEDCCSEFLQKKFPVYKIVFY